LSGGFFSSLLDATLEPRVARAWLPRLELIADINVERGAGVTVRQVTDLAVSYGRIIPGIGAEPGMAKYKSQENTAQDIMRRLEVVCAEARQQDGVAACVAPKKLEQTMEETWVTWGTKPGNLLMVHFGATRGLNALEHVSHIVVISRQEPTVAELENLVRRQFNRHPTPTLTDGLFPTRCTELRSTGNSRHVVVEAYHPDADAMACLSQIRDAEVRQAMHRGRPVRRDVDHPLAIDLITSVPVDLPIDRAIGFDEWLQEANPAQLLLARGFWPHSWTGKQVALSDRYPTAQATRRAFQENRTAAGIRAMMEEAKLEKRVVKCPNSLYRDSSIRGLGTLRSVQSWPVYRFKASGSGRRSQLVAIDPSLHPDPRAVWEARVGALESFELVDQKRRGAPCLHPKAMLAPAPELSSDILAIDRRDPASPPLPIAPLQVRTSTGHSIRYWLDAGAGQPILIRSTPSHPAPALKQSPLPRPPRREPLLDLEDICQQAGIPELAFRNAMSRPRYRKMHPVERERAALEWMVQMIGGEERFMSAVLLG
jgi:hypothetical protein